MNDVPVAVLPIPVLAKRIFDIDCTRKGSVDGHLALNALVGFITGYVPGNGDLPETTQLYILGRVEEILKSCKKSISVNPDLLKKKFNDISPLFYEKH